MSATSKTILGRLLAKENIKISYENTTTAMFSPSERHLIMPLFSSEVSNETQDLFLGHEVGHALYTPLDAIERATQERLPKGFVNIIEDIRIENAILSTYPGLRSDFRAGYKELVDRDFFGTNERPIEEMAFPDRLNLFAKLRGAIQVPFASDEITIRDRIMAVSSFEDVLLASHELVAFMKAKHEEEKKKNGSSKQQNEQKDTTSDKQKSSGSSNESQAESSTSSENSEGAAQPGDESDDEESMMSASDDLEDETSNEQVKATGTGAYTKGWADLYEVDTFNAEEDNKTKLTAKGNGIFVINRPTSEQLLSRILPNSNIRAHRETVTASFERQRARMSKRGVSKKFGKELNTIRLEEIMDKVRVFRREYLKDANAIARTFEMRRNARILAKASTSKTGKLDPATIHAYKYNDDLFKRSTIVEKAKNHGVVILIDFSGSMCHVMPGVLKQLTILVEFARRAKIPFAAYGFTTCETRNYFSGVSRKPVPLKAGDLYIDGVAFFEIISSDMSRPLQEEALQWINFRSIGDQLYNNSTYTVREALGGTPLFQALTIAHEACKKLRSEKKLDKVALVTITDGEGDNPSGTKMQKRYPDGALIATIDTAPRANTVEIEYCGKRLLKVCDRPAISGAHVLDAMRSDDITTVNFYLANRMINEIQNTFEVMAEYDASKTAKHFESHIKVRSQHYIEIENILGYDQKFIINAKSPVVGNVPREFWGKNIVGYSDTSDEEDTKSLKSEIQAMTKELKASQAAALIARSFAIKIA